MKGLHMVAWILLMVGGLNWLIYGILATDIAEWVGFSSGRIIYILFGLSALFELFTHKGRCKDCTSGSTMSAGPKM